MHNRSTAAMARLPYLDRRDLKPEHQDLLTRNINLYRGLVHSPDGLRAFSALGHFIRHTSRLDPRLREMAILQVGYLARSPYEYSHHVEIGRDFGVSARSAMRPRGARPSWSRLPRRCCARRAR
jgi:alkylhydroperoxidase family enzyme